MLSCKETVSCSSSTQRSFSWAPREAHPSRYMTHLDSWFSLSYKINIFISQQLKLCCIVSDLIPLLFKLPIAVESLLMYKIVHRISKYEIDKGKLL